MASMLPEIVFETVQGYGGPALNQDIGPEKALII